MNSLALSSQAKLASVLNDLVGHEAALLSGLHEMPVYPGEALIFVASTEFTRPVHRKSGSSRRPLRGKGSGAGITRTAALWSTIGEALERYSGSIYDHEELVEATWDALGSSAVDPGQFILFSEEQYQQPRFSYQRPRRDRPLMWVEGVEWTTGRRTLLPAQLVYFAYDYRHESEVLRQTVTTGLAAGQTFADAAFSGLREVIERDAFMSTWLLRYSPPQLRLSEDQRNALPSVLRGLLESSQVETTLLDITTDLGVPVVMCVLKSRHRDVVAVGAAAHPNLLSAITKALVEAQHTRSWTLTLQQRARRKMEAVSVESFEDHVLYYQDPAHFGDVEFLLRGPTVCVADCALKERQDRPSAEQLSELCSRLAVKGHRVLVVDVTASDVAALGLHVARVVVPSLHPMSAGVARYCLDRRRLDVIARHRKLQRPQVLNCTPHPFP